jgi:hypothetical protein
MCVLEVNISGTSNATTFTCGLPIAASSSQLVDPCIAIIRLTDNGVSTSIGCGRFGSGTSTLTFGKAPNAAGGFTNTGTKGCIGGYMFYEI